MNNTLGSNWLLLRGLSRETAHWGEFIALMQTAFPGASITTLDLPGTGRFHRETSPSDIASITQSARRQATERNLLRRPATLLALSLGGMVAWEWLSQYPEEINGAVLVNTSFANLSPFYKRLRWQSYAQFAKLMLINDIYRRELAIVRLVSNLSANHQQTALAWKKIQELHPVSLANSLRQIKAAARFRPAADRPKQAILLVNSRGDRLVAPSCSEAIQKQWQIELRTHPWAGHDLSLDDGAWLAKQLANWVAQQSEILI